MLLSELGVGFQDKENKYWCIHLAILIPFPIQFLYSTAMHITNLHLGDEVDISDGVSINNVTTGNRGKIRHHSILFGTPKAPLTIGDDFFIGVQCYCNGVGGRYHR